jgi:tetratricopeptide (TPR) repeat protein
LGLINDAAANRLGNLLVRLGRPREAIPWLAQALEWHLYPFHMIDLAKGYEASGDLTRAEDWLAETERQFPTASAGFWEAGNYYLRREQYRVAIVHFRQAVMVDPRCPYYCYGNLGRAYLAAGCPHEAAEAFAEALQRDPTNGVVAEWLRNAESVGATTVGRCP